MNDVLDKLKIWQLENKKIMYGTEKFDQKDKRSKLLKEKLFF